MKLWLIGTSTVRVPGKQLACHVHLREWYLFKGTSIGSDCDRRLVLFHDVVLEAVGIHTPLLLSDQAISHYS